MTTLQILMHGRHIANVNESLGRMTLTCVDGAAQLGVPSISVAMPTSAHAYPDEVARPFFHGLLPEGEARRMLAYDFGLAADDDFGLLAELGRDCAGALVILPVGEAPDDWPGQPPLDILADTEIGGRLRSLPVHPLGITNTIRACLPGVQPKLLLTLHDGTWCSPDVQHPSTHILKPSIAEFEHSVANEAFCMTLASRVGLPTAATSVAEFDGVSVLVSERYDRQIQMDGTTRRHHQEDACQALSVMTRTSREKYEASGGPNLRAIAEALTQAGGSVTDLLRHVTFSVLVGNADLHGKNLSFLHNGDGTVALAPIYDVMCTTYYDGHDGGRAVDIELGLFIADKTDILAVTTDDLVAEAGHWGLRAADTRDIVAALATDVAAAARPWEAGHSHAHPIRHDHPVARRHATGVRLERCCCRPEAHQWQAGPADVPKRSGDHEANRGHVRQGARSQLNAMTADTFVASRQDETVPLLAWLDRVKTVPSTVRFCP